SKASMDSIANTKELEGAISDILKPLAFRKKGPNWYFYTDECVCMINLQKSEWGGQYYINVAILVTPLTMEKMPLEYRCHIRARIDNLVPSDIDIRGALDLENHSMSSKERVRVLRMALVEYAVPFLMSLGTIDDIKKKVLEDEIVSCRTILSLKR